MARRVARRGSKKASGSRSAGSRPRRALVRREVAWCAHRLTTGPGGPATSTVSDSIYLEDAGALHTLAAPILAAEPSLVSVVETVPADDLASAFVDLGASGAAVVDARGVLLGVVTKSDIARVSARLESVTVRDAMTPSQFSLPVSATLGEAAALMGWKGVHRVPLVARDGQVLGVLGALDVIRWLAPSPDAPETR